MTDLVTLTHPNVPFDPKVDRPFVATREAFEATWKAKGWIDSDAATAKTAPKAPK